MKNKIVDNAKYVFGRFLFHGKKFVQDTVEVFKNRIDTAEKAKELLKTTANVKDLLEIEKSITGCHLVDGKLNFYMPSSEYTLYDDYNYKLYYFNGVKNDFINDEELLKVSKVIGSLNGKIKTVFCIINNGVYQYYFLLREGKNGNGDFVDDDVKNVVKYLDSMKDAGALWRCVTDVSIDIPDDVSLWAITFTV